MTRTAQEDGVPGRPVRQDITGMLDRSIAGRRFANPATASGLPGETGHPRAPRSPEERTDAGQRVVSPSAPLVAVGAHLQTRTAGQRQPNA